MPTKSKAPAPVSLGQTASEAFATIMAHNFEYLVDWEEAARSWEDIEGVHQFRVTIRRMRSALTLFQNAIPKPVTEPIGEEMRWIAGELGLARDLDVFISEGLAAVASKLPLTGAEKLQQVAEQRRARTYVEQVQSMLDSERYGRFKQDFDGWLKNKAWESAEFCRERLGRDVPLGAIDRSKLNTRGGSIALGHPFAATGSRILGSLAKMISDAGGGRGLISVCTGGGMGVAAIVEK